MGSLCKKVIVSAVNIPTLSWRNYRKNIIRGNRCSGLKVNTVQHICPADWYVLSQECHQYQQTDYNYLRPTNKIHSVFKFWIALYVTPFVRMMNYSNIYPTRCNVTQFILSGNCSTCFGWYLCLLEYEITCIDYVCMCMYCMSVTIRLN